MKRLLRFLLLLLAIILLVEVQKRFGGGACGFTAPLPPPGQRENALAIPPRPAGEKSLPVLVHLGAASCRDCRRMKPVLDALRARHAKHFEIHAIDVVENPQAGHDYGIRAIPSQIFLDENGNELLRREGFISEQDLLAVWIDLGLAP